MELKIRPAESIADVDHIRRLFEAYWTQFGFTPCFQGFADEVSGLPGKYSPPGGLLGLAWAGERPAGCVAFRRVSDTTCEVKRLYVSADFRGHGVGHRLLDWAVEEARKAGYSVMVADTLPVMETALAMYDRYGFERTGPYNETPTPGAIFLRLDLVTK
jgi:GNAT superfamily N-acetyltransferase